MAKEYLYCVSNNTPGAPNRYVIAGTPGQALAYVAKNLLGIELCDGIAGAEAVKAGFEIERAVPADGPSAAPQQPLIELQPTAEPAVEEYREALPPMPERL